MNNQFESHNVSSPPYKTTSINHWADSVLMQMSIDEKIGQLFMVAANSKNSNELFYREVDSLILNYKIGGVIFFQSGPNELKKIIKRYNHISDFPLISGIDAEWGAAMRLDSTQVFPWMMTLGAIRDNDLIYNFGERVAKQLNDLGVHINFAPVVDINNNPDNPIIDRRSFSSNKNIVAAKSLAYMRALQDNKILACAKHFPGHGDTDTDSHKALPVLYHDMARLDSLELFPFKKLIREGLGSIMVAHMNLPNIDTLGIPSSLSRYLISDVLKTKMSFDGIVISDALNMNALAQYDFPGQIELKAFLAGNDILLYPNNISEAISLIKKAVKSNKLLEQQLNHSCKQILMLKKMDRCNRHGI